MGVKAEALHDLHSVMKEFKLARSSVGRAIAGDPGFMDRMEDPSKSISTNTLDLVWRYILEQRGQREMRFEKE